MALRLYLDDCAYSRRLVAILVQSGNTVVTPADAGLTGSRDDVHLRYAASHGLILLTKNCRDFLALHQQDSNHSGVFAVYQDNDPSRDMTNGQIADSIAKLESSGVTITGEFHVLNHWQ